MRMSVRLHLPREVDSVPAVRRLLRCALSILHVDRDSGADLEIALTGNRLTISGKREQEKHEQGDTYYASERSYGSFSRAFTLPDGTDGENVKAELKNGVLEVVVPKKPEVQPRKITIGKEEASKAKA